MHPHLARKPNVCHLGKYYCGHDKVKKLLEKPRLEGDGRSAAGARCGSMVAESLRAAVCVFER